MAQPVFGYGFYRPSAELTDAEERRLLALYDQQRQISVERAEYVGSVRAMLEEEKTGKFERESAMLDALGTIHSDLADIVAAERSGTGAAALRARASLQETVVKLRVENENLGLNEKARDDIQASADLAEKSTPPRDPHSQAWTRARVLEQEKPGTLDPGTYAWMEMTHGPPPDPTAPWVERARTKSYREVARRTEVDKELDEVLKSQLLSGGSAVDLETAGANLTAEAARLEGVISGIEGDILVDISPEADATIREFDKMLKGTTDQIESLGGGGAQQQYDDLISSTKFQEWAKDNGFGLTTPQGQAVALKALHREMRAEDRGRGKADRPVPWARLAEDVREKRAGPAGTAMFERGEEVRRAGEAGERYQPAELRDPTLVDTAAEDKEIEAAEALAKVPEQTLPTRSEYRKMMQENLAGLKQTISGLPPESYALLYGDHVRGRPNEADWVSPSEYASMHKAATAGAAPAAAARKPKEIAEEPMFKTEASKEAQEQVADPLAEIYRTNAALRAARPNSLEYDKARDAFMDAVTSYQSATAGDSKSASGASAYEQRRQHSLERAKVTKEAGAKAHQASSTEPGETHMDSAEGAADLGRRLRKRKKKKNGENGENGENDSAVSL